MSPSARYLLYTFKPYFPSLLGLCLGFALFYEFTGGGENAHYGESVTMLLLICGAFLSLLPGTSGARDALSLGGRRKDIFWGLQGCALLCALWVTLLAAVANGITGALGWPALPLNPAVLLYLLGAAFVLSALGILTGLLAQNHRGAAIALFCLLVVFAMAAYFPLRLYAGGRLELWGGPPWLIPVGLALLGGVGEFSLFRLTARLTVR